MSRHQIRARKVETLPTRVKVHGEVSIGVMPQRAVETSQAHRGARGDKGRALVRVRVWWWCVRVRVCVCGGQ